ncbi:MAG: tetratricopeptide repeat protein [Usitatibacteraceae bacterium]
MSALARSNFFALVSSLLFVCTMLGGMAIAGEVEDGEKAYARKEYAQAVELFRKAATRGDAAGQFQLGTMYVRGHGVPQNYQEAAAWFLKSAVQGYALAQNSLGVRYEKGQGVAQSAERAAALYREAADQRFALAQDNLSDLFVKGLGVPQDNVLAHVWSSLASANGEAGAARKRALMERAMTQAQLAEAGTHLGTMFARGRGVAQNQKRAVQYFQNAAAHGFVGAQFELAECYDKGNGVPQDYKQAAIWFEKAAAQGHMRAQTSIAYMYEIGQGVAKTPDRAAYWYAQAAAQGDAIAQYNLGAMAESGRGAVLDRIEAHKWFNIAEVNGNQRAIGARQLVESLMTSAQIAEAQQRASDWMKKNAR